MKIGIDIGGSHIGIGLVNSNGTIILKEEKFIKDKSNIEKKIEDHAEIPKKSGISVDKNLKRHDTKPF